MKRILFLYDIKDEQFWRDGLWRALQVLEKDYEIHRWNLAKNTKFDEDIQSFDFVLGWSSFEGEIATVLRSVMKPKGLCVGGYTYQPSRINAYDVLFYETEWYADSELQHHRNKIHAFGINTDIFRPQKLPKVFDYLTIGSFSAWKRQLLILDKPGIKLAVGQVQENNMHESSAIMSSLLIERVGILPEVPPEQLATLINISKTIYLPATIMGGSERSVLEARACGVSVEIEVDNPKLMELLTSPIYDHNYYAAQLKKGIESVI